MVMAFNFFGFKSSPDKDNESKKSELSSEKIPEPTKPLSFEEALARQIQNKAESAALSTPTPEEVAVAPKDEIFFEKAQVAEEKVESVEAAPAPAPVAPPAVTEALSNAPSPSPQAVAAENVPQAPAPEQQEVPVQVPLVPATREDVIAAYKIFLDRLPENEEVITPRIGIARERILSSFMTSKYFLSRPKNIQLLLLTAIQIEQKANL
jgi:hypothetical protein